MVLPNHWRIIAALCVFWRTVHCLEESWFQVDDEDGTLSSPDLISKYGYQVESHTVTTEDGYELTMFRILPQQATKSSKLPVLMGHGLFASSADFIIIGPNNSLAYLLSDSGYDVWLPNFRGIRYSRKHSTLSPDSKAFWDFSWHELGYYDLPAMIDYILNATSASKLHYVGFSQGTTTYFVMATTRPEYNDKIALMVALSPAVLVKQVRSPLVMLLTQVLKEIKHINSSYSAFEILPHSNVYNMIAQSFCEEPDLHKNFCYKLVSLIVGPNPKAFDRKLMTAYMGHAPAGASFNQLVHYGQIARSGSFHQYDHGRERNLKRYGSKKPPAYNLKLATAPVLLYYGLNDWLVHPQNVQVLAKVLPRVVAAKPVADKRFNHIDFILAKNVRSLLYDQMIQMIDEFN